MTQKNNLYQYYNIGLDIGNASVGWSVTDRDNNLLKTKGKNMWGSHLFESGKTAESRRLARNTTRRLRRRKQRINLLKELVGSMVIQKDTDFFMKLEKGYMAIEDKNYVYNLFDDDNYSDIDYYNNYPTIYHLRKKLMTSNDKMDPRLIYLAMHHIIKYRGNFLYENQKFDLNDTSTIKRNLIDLFNDFFNLNEYELTIDEKTANEYFDILMDTKLKKAERESVLKNIINIQDKQINKSYNHLNKLLVGYDTDISILFPMKRFDSNEKLKVKFGTDKYEETIEKIESYSQETALFIEAAQKINSFIILKSILNDYSSISDAMIDRYNKHKNDLKLLKNVYKEYGDSNEYNQMFRSDNIKGSYSSYITSVSTTSIDDLYKTIQKFMTDKNVDDSIREKIEKEISLEKFLLRQNTKENGEIPYQIHLEELKIIIEKQGVFYPELRKNKDKILSLVTFKIPYYVGPLNNKSKFSWVKRSENKIYPWNFSEEVDEIASAEAFIRKMTNRCTYLLQEDVLPKKSLTISKYEVLNELNKIQIDGKSITVDLKMRIYHDLFMNKKRITEKSLIDYLFNNTIINSKDVKITGYQKDREFASSLEPWIDFRIIFGDDFDTMYDDIEKIIEWITVYEDKTILKKRLNKEYPELDDSIVKKICSKRYKGWSRLSKRLLVDLKVLNEKNEKVSILDCLYLTNQNFMQIIYNKKLKFSNLIEKENNIETTDKITYQMINELHGSPAIKKGIWQTVRIVEEIISYIGNEPQNIFIEFSRSDEESRRVDSRLKTLKDTYEKMSKDNQLSCTKTFTELKKVNNSRDLWDEKLYLYYLQNAKCMYSGESLDIDKLNLYQVDHIIPQSYIKDNSIDNKVLVKAKENQYKGDNLLLNIECIRRQNNWWEKLKKYGLISEKKYNNLTRTVISDEQTVGFINRQLVETRQIIKHVSNLFKNVYVDTNIVAVKAGLSTDFRDKFGLFKLRNLNDYHHAQDAFIATMIGNYVLHKYPVLKDDFIFDHFIHKNLFKDDIKQQNTLIRNKKGSCKHGFIINQIGTDKVVNDETGEIIWDGKEMIEKVKIYFNYNDCFITKKPEERTGQLFNVTILSAEEIRNKKDKFGIIPVNKNRSDISKYGGFSGIQYSYAIAVEYQKRNKVVRTLLGVPIHMSKAKPEELYKYLSDSVGTDDIKIIHNKILFNQEFEFDNGVYYLASANEWNNARQLLLSEFSRKAVYQLMHSNNDDTHTDEFNKAIMIAYDEYIEKLQKFYPMYQGFAKKLIDHRDNFISLSNTDKRNVFNQMLIVTKADATNGNISLNTMNISSRIGRISGKNMDLNRVTFIHKSVTGLYEKKYKL